jgi:signal transduction histidine kinase
MNLTGRLRAGIRRTVLADVAVAVVVYAVTLIITAAAPTGSGLGLIAVVSATLACGPLAVRRRYPFAVLTVSAVAAEAYLGHFGGRGSLVLTAPLIALYTVAEVSTRRRALIIGALVVLAFSGLHTMVRPASWLGAENLALAALGGLAVAAGDAARNRRAYLAEVEGRARHAEVDWDAEAARRVTEERLRIAHELHDVIGHQLALVFVQAGVAAQVLGTAPAQAREALGHIRAASKTALTELSDTVGLLRQAGDQPALTVPVSGPGSAEHIDGPVRPLALPPS